MLRWLYDGVEISGTYFMLFLHDFLFVMVPVRVYKCRYMVAYCGQCLSMDSEYHCGWCQSPCETSGKCDGTCSLQTECPSDSTSKWLDRSSTCPNPQITRVNTSLSLSHPVSLSLSLPLFYFALFLKSI